MKRSLFALFSSFSLPNFFRRRPPFLDGNFGHFQKRKVYEMQRRDERIRQKMSRNGEQIWPGPKICTITRLFRTYDHFALHLFKFMPNVFCILNMIKKTMLANVSPVSPKSCFFPRLQHPSEDPSLVRIPFHLFFFFPSSVSRSSSRLRLHDDMAADSGNRPPFPTHWYTNPSNQSRYLHEPLLRVMSARVLACIRSAGILEEKWGHEYVMSARSRVSPFLFGAKDFFLPHACDMDK